MGDQVERDRTTAPERNDGCVGALDDRREDAHGRVTGDAELITDVCRLQIDDDELEVVGVEELDQLAGAEGEGRDEPVARERTSQSAGPVGILASQKDPRSVRGLSRNRQRVTCLPPPRELPFSGTMAQRR